MFDDHDVVHNAFWKSLQASFDANDPRAKATGPHRYPTDLNSESDLNAFLRSVLRQERTVFNEDNPVLSLVIRHPSIIPVRVDLVHASPQTGQRTVATFSSLQPALPNTSLPRLVADHMLSQQMADFLMRVICADANVYVGGSTGIGKTTFLRALLIAAYKDLDARLLTIESFAELANNAYHEALPLATSLIQDDANSMEKMIRASLRMRPERIVVGEVRNTQGAYALGEVPLATTYHHKTPRQGVIAVDEMELTTGVAVAVNSVVVLIEKNLAGTRYVRGIYQICMSETGLGKYANPLFECTDPEGLVFEQVGLATRSFRRKFETDKASQHPPVTSTTENLDRSPSRTVDVTPEEAQEMLDALEVLQKFFRRLL